MMGAARDDHSGDDDALKARLHQLTKVLDEKRQATDDAKSVDDAPAPEGIGKAMGAGFRVATELAAAILVGGFIGWQLDKWLGSSPWLSVIFLMLGIAAGFWNVYKLAARPTMGVPPAKD